MKQVYSPPGQCVSALRAPPPSLPLPPPHTKTCLAGNKKANDLIGIVWRAIDGAKEDINCLQIVTKTLSDRGLLGSHQISHKQICPRYAASFI